MMKVKNIENLFWQIQVGGGNFENQMFPSRLKFAFEGYEDKYAFFNRNFLLNPLIQGRVEQLSREFDISNCLGLYMRGTDYISLKPASHFIQPTPEDISPMVDDAIKKYGCKVFLVTEDSSIKLYFLNEFNDNIVTLSDDIVMNEYKNGKMLCDCIETSDRLDVGQVYLIKILLLSKCKYLIAGKTNGSLMALVFNGGQYENVYLYDRGVY